jgi:hypothetical protein
MDESEACRVGEAQAGDIELHERSYRAARPSNGGLDRQKNGDRRGKTLSQASPEWGEQAPDKSSSSGMQ